MQFRFALLRFATPISKFLLFFINVNFWMIETLKLNFKILQQLVLISLSSSLLRKSIEQYALFFCQKTHYALHTTF
jgi:hypothetical protein